ncbi:MAG: hypothetical protein HZY73_04390 [Micropruina sp.]|nr:MAG: hypothetical protein HZY73_04390 [Micropruina sp.]
MPKVGAVLAGADEQDAPTAAGGCLWSPDARRHVEMATVSERPSRVAPAVTKAWAAWFVRSHRRP